LNGKEDVGCEAEDGVGRLEMRAIVVKLVEFDNDETCYEEVEAEVNEKEVRCYALSFLGFGVRRLQDEDGLCE
jgi:hypothetical protein